MNSIISYEYLTTHYLNNSFVSIQQVVDPKNPRVYLYALWNGQGYWLKVLKPVDQAGGTFYQGVTEIEIIWSEPEPDADSNTGFYTPPASLDLILKAGYTVPIQIN